MGQRSSIRYYAIERHNNILYIRRLKISIYCVLYIDSHYILCYTIGVIDVMCVFSFWKYDCFQSLWILSHSAHAVKFVRHVSSLAIPILR